MSADEIAGRLLVDVALVIALGRALAVLLARIGQPPVLAEIFAGIVLGPSLFGAIAPGPWATLFPGEVTQALAGLGDLGLVLFMFFVGLELDSSTAWRHGRSVARISIGSLAVPFCCGLLLAVSLYDAHDTAAGQEVPLLAFMLFIATAMSVTAFPVLARILADHGLTGTRLGAIAISSAASQDLAGWLLLGVSLAVAEGSGAVHSLLVMLAAIAIGAALFGIVRPLLRRSLASGPGPAPGEPAVLALVLVILAASAGATQLIGLHSAIGAFLFGIAFPRDCLPSVLPSLRQSLWPLTMVVLLPIYFLGPGLNFEAGQIGANGLLELAAIIVVACVAKWAGTAGAARYSGYSRHDATALGILLNTRGLVELIILNIGLTAAVLDRTLYSEFVLMALVTTLMTGPLLRAARRGASGAMWQVALPEGQADGAAST